MIEFAQEYVKAGFDSNICQGLREIILRLDAYCYAKGLKRIVVTKVSGIEVDGYKEEYVTILIGTRYSAEEYANIVYFIESNFPRQEKGEDGRPISTTSVCGTDENFSLKITTDRKCLENL